MTAEELLQEAAGYEEKLITTRRFLHTHPGTGFDIEDTVAYVKQELIAMGYEPKSCGRAGLIALAGKKENGKTFLLRADMDALPLSEEADVEFASTNGKMHACGHDMHTTMLLGAAKLLKNHEDEINGTVKLMFQPAEEIFEGSHDMIEAGLLKNPDVDAALMIHVMASMPMQAGTVIVSDSMKAAGCPDGDYDLGGQPVYVRDGKALLADGTIAASTSNVYKELKNVISFGIPEKQAVKSATINPAKAIRADRETGSIEEGKLADILVVDKDYNIKLVIVKGKIKVNNL